MAMPLTRSIASCLKQALLRCNRYCLGNELSYRPRQILPQILICSHRCSCGKSPIVVPPCPQNRFSLHSLQIIACSRVRPWKFGHNKAVSLVCASILSHVGSHCMRWRGSNFQGWPYRAETWPDPESQIPDWDDEEDPAGPIPTSCVHVFSHVQ